MSDLRDHSQPCEHDEAFLALDSIGGLDVQTRAWKCKKFGCPGGRKLTLREVVAWVNAEFAAAIGDTG